MSQEILNILLSALGIIVTGLVGWGVTTLTTWLNSKIKDKKIAQITCTLTTIVSDAVMEVFQCFVETLKKNGKFDTQAQKEAKERAMDIIMNKLTPELKNYISSNFGDIKEWISSKIETTIYSFKLNAKNK